MTLTPLCDQIENSLISNRAGTNAGQSKLTRTPPEAAKEGAQRWALATTVNLRMRRQEYRYQLVVARAVKPSMPKAMRGTKHCKAQSAMQSHHPGRRRGVPRLLLPCRSEGSRIVCLQEQRSPHHAHSDA